MRFKRSLAIRLSLLCVVRHRQRAAASAPDDSIEEIVVTGEFRSDPLDALPSSVSVATAAQIASLQAQHLEQVLALMPNVNVASGASRARYFQIRGIGETGQFIAPLNPSVGTIIDHVDFSGIATVSTLYDVRQVEVFRGPQGTLYGANALAGLDQRDHQRSRRRRWTRASPSKAATTTRARVGGYVSGPLSDSVAGTARRSSNTTATVTYAITSSIGRHQQLRRADDARQAALAGRRRYVVRFRRRLHRHRQRLRRVLARTTRATRSRTSPAKTRRSRSFGSVIATFTQPKTFLMRGDRGARRFRHRVRLRRGLDVRRLRSQRLQLHRPVRARLDDLVSGTALRFERRRAPVRRHAPTGRSASTR